MHFNSSVCNLSMLKQSIRVTEALCHLFADALTLLMEFAVCGRDFNDSVSLLICGRIGWLAKARAIEGN